MHPVRGKGHTKKDNSSTGGATPAALAGNWTFVSLTAHTQSTVTETGGGVTDNHQRQYDDDHRRQQPDYYPIGGWHYGNEPGAGG